MMAGGAKRRDVTFSGMVWLMMMEEEEDQQREARKNPEQLRWSCRFSSVVCVTRDWMEVTSDRHYLKRRTEKNSMRKNTKMERKKDTRKNNKPHGRKEEEDCFSGES